MLGGFTLSSRSVDGVCYENDASLFEVYLMYIDRSSTTTGIERKKKVNHDSDWCDSTERKEMVSS